MGKLLDFLIVLSVSVILYKTQESVCKLHLLSSYGLRPYRDTPRPNSLCPKVKDNCCDEISQMKLHKYHSSFFHANMKKHYESSIAAFAKLQPMLEDRAKIDFLQLKKEYMVASFAMNNKTQQKLNDVVERLNKTSGDALMVAFNDVLKKQKDMFAAIQKLRTGFLCSICDRDVHGFINYDTNMITYKGSFCKQLVASYFDIIYTKITLVLQYVIDLHTLLSIMTGKKLIKNRQYYKSIKRYKVILTKYKGTPDDAKSCWDVCSEFKINMMTPLFDGEFQEIEDAVAGYQTISAKISVKEGMVSLFVYDSIKSRTPRRPAAGGTSASTLASPINSGGLTVTNHADYVPIISDKMVDADLLAAYIKFNTKITLAFNNPDTPADEKRVLKLLIDHMKQKIDNLKLKVGDKIPTSQTSKPKKRKLLEFKIKKKSKTNRILKEIRDNTEVLSSRKLLLRDIDSLKIMARPGEENNVIFGLNVEKEGTGGQYSTLSNNSDQENTLLLNAGSKKKQSASLINSKHIDDDLLKPDRKLQKRSFGRFNSRNLEEADDSVNENNSFYTKTTHRRKLQKKKTSNIEYGPNHSQLSRDVTKESEIKIIKTTAFMNHDREKSVIGFDKTFKMFNGVISEDKDDDSFSNFYPLQEAPKSISNLKVTVDEEKGIDLYAESSLNELTMEKDAFIKLLFAYLTPNTQPLVLDSRVKQILAASSVASIKAFVNDVRLKYGRYISKNSISKMELLEKTHTDIIHSAENKATSTTSTMASTNVPISNVTTTDVIKTVNVDNTTAVNVEATKGTATGAVADIVIVSNDLNSNNISGSNGDAKLAAAKSLSSEMTINSSVLIILVALVFLNH